jgi:hypothetical protein
MLSREITFVVKIILLPVNIQGGSYNFDIVWSDNDNQIALSPTIVNGELIKLRIMFLI